MIALLGSGSLRGGAASGSAAAAGVDLPLWPQPPLPVLVPVALAVALGGIGVEGSLRASQGCFNRFGSRIYFEFNVRVPQLELQNHGLTLF